MRFTPPSSPPLCSPLSPRSVLDVGSISKQFTAMTILMLEKEGKLSLDDPVRKYIPEMPAYAGKISIRRALSQTSGLRDLYTMMGQTGRTFSSRPSIRIRTSSAWSASFTGHRHPRNWLRRA